MQFNHVANGIAIVLAGKAAVIGRMPVLCRHDQIKPVDHVVRHRHNLISFRNGQCAAGQKVVLDINKDKCAVHGSFFVSNLKVETLFHQSVVLPFVEPIQPGRSVSDVGFDFVQLLQHIHAEDFFSEVSFVQIPFQNDLV